MPSYDQPDFIAWVERKHSNNVAVLMCVDHLLRMPAIAKPAVTVYQGHALCIECVVHVVANEQR